MMARNLPATAAVDTTAHEARISELEAKVERLEALLEQRYGELDAARAADVEAPLASHPTLYNETEIKVGG